MFWRGDLHGQIREYTGPDGWNDPDYLMYGNIFNWRTRKVEPSPYSPSEYYSSMTLWSITSSPLFFSGEITSMDDFTLNVLCNAEVIAINQDKLGKSGYSIHYEALIDIWKKEVHDGSTAIAIFNKRPFDSRVEMDWKALGYTGKFLVRDLWRQKDLGNIQKVTSFDIPRHGCVLLKISK
jgi:alpha-galactosidase